MTLVEACAMAERERVRIAVTELPECVRGRLIRVFDEVWIRIGRHVPESERHIVIMHELAHFWRDDPGVMCAYCDDQVVNEAEEFADIFAWAVTSPARGFVLRERET